ncbi:hypothetical protein CALCODRAFT_148693 [Calocera cornea HHB12733]|uniref:Uncharacterized protein n=1 Tax=Calocera cornea HHB12733 TaxID=1353952 RepID=A0A165CPY0_9BASI|nr:hypothetical protein CALCODRAFT_148693 [Calocera cornea HHB12733]
MSAQTNSQIRAEHSRHIQNLGHMARQSPATANYAPTLPFLLPAPVLAVEPAVVGPAQQPQQPVPKKPAGPPPPRSWVSPSHPANPGTDLLAATPESGKLREELLSFIFRRLPSPWDVDALPTLLDWCLLSLLDPFDAETIEDLPPHLRQRLVRLAAIHHPLTHEQLRICWGDDYSGTGGEAIAIGREASGAVRELLRALRPAGEAPAPAETWDTPIHLLAAPQLPVLQTLVLVKTSLPILSILPRTLTHLSLVSCNFDAVRTARNLPKILPLLEWIEIRECVNIEGSWFEALDWSRWTALRGVRLIPIQHDWEVGTGGGARSPGAREEWKRRVERKIEAGRAGEVEIWFDFNCINRHQMA